jgi:hypothetical protein
MLKIFGNSAGQAAETAATAAGARLQVEYLAHRGQSDVDDVTNEFDLLRERHQDNMYACTG